MNENINLVEILKDYPKGTKLYSPLFGIVELQSIDELKEHPIIISFEGDLFFFTKEGKLYNNEHGECLLFPYKDYRDWGKFTIKKPKFSPKALKPFDKVLIRDTKLQKWSCDLFSYIGNEEGYPYICVNSAYNMIIPYNDDTKHLVGTNKEAPEYYRYWEE